MYQGIPSMGAVLHTINPRLTPEQLRFIVEEARDGWIFCDRSLAAVLAPRLPELRRLSAFRGVVVLDEGNRMNEKSWASLAPLLDHRRYVESIVAGITIHAHPDFRCAVTMNEDESTYEIPDYILSRLQPTLTLGHPAREDEIADTLAFLDAVRADLVARGVGPRVRTVVLGFSQGGSTAFRWAARGAGRVDQVARTEQHGEGRAEPPQREEREESHVVHGQGDQAEGEQGGTGIRVEHGPLP